MKKIMLLLLAALLWTTAANAQTGTVVVAEGTTTNSYVPVYGYYADAVLRCQTIYPATMMADLTGAEIQGLVYYMASPVSTSYGDDLDGTFEVKIGTCTASAFADDADEFDETTLTTVYTGTLDLTSSAQVTITFTTPFTYTGGNLMIEVSQTVESNDYGTTSFYGISSTGASLQSYDGWSGPVISVQDFIPKTGFIVPVSCGVPTIGDITTTETSATISWTEDVASSSWSFRLNDGAWQTITTNPYTVSGLTANTAYTFALRAICGAGDTSFAATGSFRTPCTAIAAAELPYYESFENNLACWDQQLVSGSIQWVADASIGYSYTTTPVSGDNAASIAGEEGQTRLISPVFNVEGVENLTLKFAHIQQNYAGDQDELTVEYRLSSSSAWQTLATYTDDISDWAFETITIPATSSTLQIAFNATLGYGYGVGLDSLILFSASCTEPIIDVVTPEENSATITWAETGTATSWAIRLNDGEWQTATTQSYTFDGLTSATLYSVTLRSICGAGDTSFAVSTSFRTLCGRFQTPYSEDFESHTSGEAPLCWNLVQSYTPYSTSYPYITTTGNPGKSIYMYSGDEDEATSTIIATGRLDRNANACFLRFDANVYYSSYSSYNDTLYIGVVTDPADPATFVSAYKIAGSDNQNAWETYEINLSTIDAISSVSSNYIAFKMGGDYGNAYIDNVYISEPPTCDHVNGLAFSAVTENSATASWTSDATEFDVKYRIGDGAWTTVAPNPTTTSASLTGLQSATNYEVQVRAICGAADTSEAVSGTFHTLCNSIATADLPYFEGFESGIDCWNQQIISGTSQWVASATVGSSYSGISPLEGTKAASIYNTTSTTYENRLISPLFNVADAENLTLKFAHVQKKYGSDQDSLVVEYRTSDSDEWHRLAGYTNNISTWTVETLALPAVSSSLQIAFHAYLKYGYGVGIDSVTVLQVSCGNPAITETNATDNSITISWTGSAPQFGVTLNDGAEEMVTGNTKTFTGLDASTEYTITVRSICGAGDTSEAVTITLRTPCATEAFPYSEGFESYTTGSGNFPDCWTSVTGNNYVNGYHSSEGSKSLQIYGPGTVTTPIINIAGSDVFVSFDLECESLNNSGSLVVGVATSPASADAAIWIDTIQPATEDEFLRYEYTYLNTLNVQNGCIVFKQINASSSWYYWLDNLVVTTPPTCIRPTDLVIAPYETSVTLSWSENGSATQWLVKVGDNDYQLVNTNPCTIEGLTANTDYAVVVRAFCGEGDTSDVLTGSFSTPCPALSAADLPYFDGFESDDFDCWNEEVLRGSIHWACTTYTQYTAVEGTKYARFGGAYNSEARLISPVFNTEGASDLTLSFAHAQKEWSGDQDSLKVEYRLSPTSAWQTLATYTDGITAFESVTFSIPETSSTFQFAFHAYSNYGYGVVIDSVSLTAGSVVVPCATPTNVTATNATEGSVVVSWNGSASQYEIEVTNTAAGTTTTYTANASPYTVAGLNSETNYSVKVRALCEGGETSNWSTSASFSTTAPAPCNTPTGLSVTNRAGNNITIAWEGTAAQYEIEATNTRNNTVTNYTTTETTYMITGLSSGTTYSIRVRAICSANNTSEWTAPVEGTTAGQNGISDVEAANAIRIYPNPTSVSTTINIEGVNGVVKIDIVDMNGRIIKSETTGCNNGCTKQIEVADMAKGAYFVRVSNDKLNVVRKLIVK